MTKHSKPHDVLYAEFALWAWTAWACLYGIYETWRQIPDLEDIMNNQMQGLVSIDPHSLLHMAIGGYACLAAISAFFVYKIGQGRHWARSSVLWGFALELLIEFIPPYHAPIGYISAVPEFGLQIYALYLLYTPSSRTWFLSRNESKKTL